MLYAVDDAVGLLWAYHHLPTSQPNGTVAGIEQHNMVMLLLLKWTDGCLDAVHFYFV